ncbi:phosphoribosyl-AMP cyclohydrolase [Micromonospora chokoriensis]|uniref:Phosphoribosyl-AMP cyclohydrolase n=1 Tax=Micromonospora chokoriensis TaxID=356851 RepID=A0A1C4WYM8_9ACTN|nr:phosphoribosyl-AMP cyclohydrolase [Micromonospora chokoriensis]SCF01244.1 phosphoribosyl-AMP cyclohydrolase [Micromonospora chokoriensis]
MGHPPLPDSGFLEDWAARLRQAAERPVVGILLRGSHARRAATAHSDVDLDVLVGGAPYAARRAYLAETAGRVTHVSVAARDVRSWVHRLGEPADWAFGLPVSTPARLLWADPHWRPRIDLPVLCQPAEPPRLEEMIATLGKAAAARAVNDRLGVRLAVADLARLCPSVLRPANPSVRVHSRRAAFAAALDLPVAPPGYRADMLLCLGLRPGATSALWAAAVRLVAGTLPLIRPYAEEIADTSGADLAAALVDGRLDRYVAQLARPVAPAPQHDRERSPVPAPRAGQLVTVPVPDAPATGVPSDPSGPVTSEPARPSRLDPAIAARLRRSADGLVAAVVRAHDSGEVLMVAWMDDEALHRTLTTGRATYWSRSRREYWVKGATSGHHQYVRSVALDCDGDALLVSVEQVGAACHTGHRTCFFTELPVTTQAQP